MDKKQANKQWEPSSEASTPESVTFIEGDSIFPLPTHVTRTTLGRLFGMKSSDSLESILSSLKKKP